MSHGVSNTADGPHSHAFILDIDRLFEADCCCRRAIWSARRRSASFPPQPRASCALLPQPADHALLCRRRQLVRKRGTGWCRARAIGRVVRSPNDRIRRFFRQRGTQCPGRSRCGPETHRRTFRHCGVGDRPKTVALRRLDVCLTRRKARLPPG